MGQPLDRRVEIGHVRLAVADLERAIRFYAGALGFEVTRRIGSTAAFLGAGGVDHHIALHTFDAQHPPPAGPYRFALRYPDRAALTEALARLDAAGAAVDGASDDGFSEALQVTDPDGHQLELYYDRPRADQGREEAAESTPTSGRLLVDALRSAAAPREGGQVGAPPGLSDASRQRLRDLRTRLLHLHKVLLEDTRAAYELDRGRVGSNANLLQLVINDPWFAWLHSLSEMVVRIDEAVEPDSPATQPEAALLVDQVERLLTASESGDGFARRYYEALQRQPAVVLAHADVRRVLKSMR
jgi:catechol 2,3-dioxygenase